ncbi:glycosyltransferase family 2 protein [Amylibacter sp. SFDW26]|uniref:glycosyltransferase family 2 protein n=1 Tax=Amylibacter sp. SFDW26 TaxID=2652722 RepID=UPI001262A3A1|nr:glycosyltransferase [Amylibacter sp. SFDW26]KAB7610441.1 glycosyltransferase family 2 protein [Amylibacter sp. SFDW26]
MTNSTLDTLCIAICTRERRTLLIRLLASLAQIEIPHNVKITVLIIENDTEPKLQKTLLDLKYPFEIKYINENNIGLVHARNRALDEAKKIRANWVAFLDDDEEVDIDWLKSYVNAVHCLPNAKIFFGSVWYRYPNNYSPYLRQTKPSSRKLGKLPQIFDTGNVLLHTSTLQAGTLDHRFDHQFNFSGGEDTEFFTRLKDLGYKICYVPNAKIFEDKTGNRALLSSNLERSRRNQTNYCRMARMYRGKLYSVMANILIANRQIVYGLSALIFGLAIYLFNQKYARYYLGDSMMRLFRLLGVIDHARGIVPSFYLKVDHKEAAPIESNI